MKHPATATSPSVAPEPATISSTPPADSDATATPRATPLRARYVLVEDLDHLVRTGESRQVLAMRWER
jgi:hypothetical protein